MSNKETVFPQQLNNKLRDQINNDMKQGNMPSLGCKYGQAIRRDPTLDKNTLLRPSFIRDADKIMSCPYYNRYADKTQVFSFYRNDDLTRRALHVQLVSRISRNIGRLLNLNLDLIEAIALGHDIGHTPFGHAGERFLNDLYFANTHRHFSHNIHSVRVLDRIFPRNISLQVLDGILCHNGEFEGASFTPVSLEDFDSFENIVEDCYVQGKTAIEKLIPSTLEGCVVRICDIVAYLGKDRQDAWIAKIFPKKVRPLEDTIGIKNSTIVNNLVVNIVENSYGKPYICMSPAYFEAMRAAKKDNGKHIYQDPKITRQYDEIIQPMFAEIYAKLLDDLNKKRTDTVIFKHHIDFINKIRKNTTYEKEENNQIVVDYIASMTDDYFLDLYKFLFPDSVRKIDYISYFNDISVC